MRQEFVKYIRDPIHGLIGVYGHELDVIDLPIFQRLRNISQLSFSQYVYPSAKHSRFEHSVGVLQTISDYYRALMISDISETDYKDFLSDSMFEHSGGVGLYLKLRMVALLHDIGHPPFSHGFEAVLKHSHEEYTLALLDNSSIRDVLFTWGWSDKDINDLKSILKGPLSTEEAFLKSMISSSIDADRMDYLLRDSYHCGVKYGVYDYPRLMRGPAVRTFYKDINGGREVVDIVFNSKVVEEVENFLLARYRMFIQVYLHRTYIGFLNVFWKIYEWLVENEDELGVKIYPEPDDLYLEEELIERDEIWFLSLLKSIHRQLKKPYTHYSFEAIQKDILEKLIESILYRKRVKPLVDKLMVDGRREEIEKIKDKIKDALNKQNIPSGAVMIDTRSFQIYTTFKPDYHVYIYDKTSDKYYRIDQLETSIISHLAEKEISYLRIYALEEYAEKVSPFFGEYIPI